MSEKTQVNITLTADDEARLTRIQQNTPELRLLSKTAVVKRLYQYGVAVLEAQTKTP